MRTTPFYRVTIGNDKFKSGERRNRSVVVELSEDARVSNCKIEIYDPGLEIAGKYFVTSYKEGGIRVPKNLLQEPQPIIPPSVPGTGLINTGTSATTGTPISSTGAGIGEWLINRSPHIPDDQKAAFWQGVQELSNSLGINPDFLPMIMITETGIDGEIDPSAGHSGDEGCGGLIQFCSWGGAAEVGYSPTAIRAMSAIEQLPLIRQYLSTKGIPQGADLATTYLSILHPASMSIPRGQDLGVPGYQSEHLYDSSGRMTKESIEAGIMEKARVSEYPGNSGNAVNTVTTQEPKPVSAPIAPPAVNGAVLPVPYYSQRDNIEEAYRTCNTSSNAMVAKYFGAPISGDDEYFQYVKKYGDTTDHGAQTQALLDVGIQSVWNTNLDFPDIDESLSQGLPVLIGILHRGSLSAPYGGHMLVVIGKNSDGSYVVNDPFGNLLDDYTSENGQNLSYPVDVLSARWLAEGSGSGWGRTFYGNTPNPPAGQISVPQPTGVPSTQSVIVPQEDNIKGTEIIIEIGYSLDNLLNYHFIHTGTSTKGIVPGITSFEGKSIRWKMSRRIINTTWQNVTLREIAQEWCEANGYILEMEGDGVKYEFLDATGITFFELLLRETKSLGFRITDNGNILKITPYRPEFTGFIIVAEDLISNGLSFTDRATSDRSRYAQTPSSSTAQPTNKSADNTMALDSATGMMTQQNPEDSRDTKGMGTAVTGSSNEPITGVIAKDSGTNTTSNVSKIAQAVGLSIPRIPELVNLSYEKILPESITGLPKQKIGTIDLADGTAQAEEIKDEARRIKSYESSASLKMSAASLQLAPGSIIAIDENLFPDTQAKEAFGKEWRVSNVRHIVKVGSPPVTEIDFYTPQAQKPASSSPPSPQGTGLINEGSTPQQGSTPPQQGTTNLIPGSHIYPMSLDGNSSCGAICEFGYARGRLHAGIDVGGYGSGSNPDAVWATADGVVDFIQSPPEPGYGNYIDILHPDGVITRYAHLAEIKVSVRQQVKQGEIIGIRGNTGGDFDIHLHFEMRPGSSPGNPGEPVDPRTLLPNPGLINAETGTSTNNS